MAIAYLLLGSNLGNKYENVKESVRQIALRIGAIEKISSVYESTPWGFEHPEDFYNQVLCVETVLSPHELMWVLLDIEQKMGRVRNKIGYEARCIDLDILFYDAVILHDPDLELPHPRLHLRRFTLLPLDEIAPEMIHPLLKKKVKELLQSCEDKGKVAKINS